jgi:hypothetical protein
VARDDPKNFPEDGHGVDGPGGPVVNPRCDSGVIGSNSDVVVTPPRGPQFQVAVHSPQLTDVDMPDLLVCPRMYPSLGVGTDTGSANV